MHLFNHLKSQEAFQLEIAQNNNPWRMITATAGNLVLVEPTTQGGGFALYSAGLIRGTGATVLREKVFDLLTVREKFTRISSSRCWSIFFSNRHSKIVSHLNQCWCSWMKTSKPHLAYQLFVF
jgi:hypothetical protein